MKRKLSLVIATTLLLFLCACTNGDDSSQNRAARAMNGYEAFLAGEQSVKQKGWDDEIWIDSWFNQRDPEWNRYAFFDMNGDGIPELHIDSTTGYRCLSYINDKLVVWCGGLATYGTRPLNNGAIINESPVSANGWVSYAYIVLDFYGNEQLQISFDKSNPNEHPYRIYDEKSLYHFEGIEVSREQWDALTEKYLSIGSDKIEWVNAERN